MTTVTADISRALVLSVQAVGLGIPTGWQNMEFTDKPTDGGPWAQVFSLLNDTVAATLGDEGEDSHGGILQINLNYPLNAGTRDVDDQCDKLRSSLKAGTALANGVFKGWIVSCSVARGRESNGMWLVPVSVRWSGRAPRS